jgi:hypothetical protein
MDHRWELLVATIRDHPNVVTVCAACGEARYKEVNEFGGEEHRIDLSGDCPGRPHRPSRYATREQG